MWLGERSAIYAMSAHLCGSRTSGRTSIAHRNAWLGARKSGHEPMRTEPLPSRSTQADKTRVRLVGECWPIRSRPSRRRRPEMHAHRIVTSRDVGRQEVHSLVRRFATRANTCAHLRRTSNPSHPGFHIQKVAGLLRRHCCGPVRVADTQPATQSLSAAAILTLEARYACPPQGAFPVSASGPGCASELHSHTWRPCTWSANRHRPR